jgi:hypothetical protein
MVKKRVIVILSLSLEQPKRPHPRRLDYDAFPSFPAWRFALPIAQIADLSEINTLDIRNLAALYTLIRSTTSLIASTNSIDIHV